MTGRPYLKFYCRDWLTGTRTLSPEARGIYCDIIMLMQDRGGPLRMDEMNLCRDLGLMNPRTLRRILGELFTKNKLELRDGWIVNKRVSRDMGESETETEIEASSADQSQINRASSAEPAEKIEEKQTPISPSISISTSIPIKKESPLPPKGGGDGDQPNLIDERAGDDDLDVITELERGSAGEAARAWNAMAAKHGLPRIAKLTADRKRKIDARLKDLGGIDAWCRAVNLVPANSFNLGQNDRGWKADIEWFLRPGKALKLLEAAPKTNGEHEPDEAGAAAFLRAMEAYDAGGRKGPRPKRSDFVAGTAAAE